MKDIKVVCFDLDETLISHNSWLDLSLGLGMTPKEDTRLLKLYESGEITYEEWNDHVLAHYMKHDDATREGVTRILSKYTLNDGAREAVQYLREKDYELVLVSGSIDIIVSKVAHDLGITYAKANNTFEFDDTGKLVGIHTHGNDTIAKAEHLESFCDLLEVGMDECACIADGFNDIEMFKRTGRGITFRGSRIESEAWKVIDSLNDIKNVL